MRKRTKFKSPVLDFFVVVLTLSVAGYFGWTFWKDLNNSSSRDDKDKIAIITFKNRIAQRKYEDRVVWERIDKSTPLYNGDLVRTAELAEAVITFNDGSEVNIYENTMIQVYYSDFEGVNISVGNGNLQVESSDKGNVQLTMNDGSKVKAGGGTSLSAKTSAGSSGTKSVQVQSGSATVTGSSGVSETMSAGQSISVKSSGEIAKQPVTVTSIPPELRVLNVEGNEVPVKLEWNKVNTNQPVVLQTSTKKDFSQITEEKVISSVNDSLINLSEGTLYWRIFPQGNSDEVTEGKISVEAAKPLELVSPADAGVFQYRNRSPVLNFRWNGNDYAKNYLLKISSTPDMQTPVYNKVVVNNSVQVDSLGSGQWWWQVTPYYELNSIGYAGASKVASFIIERTEAISPPSLTVPLQSAEIHYKDSLDVNFSWKSDIKASYELLVSADEEFKDIITRRKTAGQRATVSLTAPEKDGTTYYWKVIRNSSEPDDFTPESAVREFTVSKYVSVPTKLIYPPEEYSTESSKVSSIRFTWKPSDEAKANAKESTIQISKSKDFSTIQVEKTVPGTTVENLTLPSGEYYWRVATEGMDGEKDYTQPNHLVVQKELTAPSVTNVVEDAEVLVAKDSPVKLNWTPVQGADYYNVRVYDSANKLVAESAEALGTTASFALPDDNYSVKIQAVASQTDISPLRTGPVQTVDFTVRTPDLITAVSPAPAAKIDGLTALRTPTNFTWKAGRDKASSTELIIKKRQDDGTQRIVERIKTSKTSAEVPRLTSGSYTWQIVASTAAGVPINSEPVSFTVTPVTSLATPLLMAPKHNLKMDSSYLRKNRSISFEWKAVADATEYNFVIYRKEKNGSLTPVYTEKGIKDTKVKFKNLAVLDVGEFEWDVTAFSIAKDGYEERRSQVARASFKISFDAPKQITTERTKRMFRGE
jgi:hypothetical protein